MEKSENPDNFYTDPDYDKIREDILLFDQDLVIIE